jgi:hypothetical protein
MKSEGQAISFAERAGIGVSIESDLEKTLLRSFVAALTGLRIIHGQSIVVQRKMVSAIMARTWFVLDWTDAPPERGKSERDYRSSCSLNLCDLKSPVIA